MRTIIVVAGALLVSISGNALAADTEALLDLGEYHLRRGDPASALNYYRKAVQQEGKNLYAHIGVQVASRQTGKDVFEEYEKSFLNDPKDPRAAYLYSRLLVPEKAFEALKGVATPDFFVHLARAKALRHMEDGRQKDEIQLASHRCPKDARAQCLLARYFEEDGEVDVAKLWFEKAVKLAPKRIDALVGLGNSLRLMGDPGAALKHLRAAQAVDNSDHEVHYRVGLAYHDLESFQLARKAYDEALKRKKDDVEILLAYGDSYSAEEQYRKAETWYRRAVEASPRRTDARRRLGYALERQGDGDPEKNDEALEHFEEIAKIDPLNAHCHIAIGWILTKKGKYDTAIKEFRQAADLDTKEATSWFFLGYAFDMMGKWKEASMAYLQAIKRDPEYARAHNNLGLDHDFLGKPSKAIKCFRRALDLDPENPEYALNLANAYYNNSKYKEAASIFSDIVDRHPKEIQGWTGLGRCLRKLRKYKESLHAYEEAIKLKPDDPELQLIAGIICERHLKDYPKALEYYNQYIFLGGEDPLVQDWIDALQKKMK